VTPVSELLAVKIENLQLRLDALRLQHEALGKEQQALLDQARAEVGASPEATVYNFATRTFSVPGGPRPLSMAENRRAKRMKARA
jgi:hypothetical protein